MFINLLYFWSNGKGVSEGARWNTSNFEMKNYMFTRYNAEDTAAR